MSTTTDRRATIFVPAPSLAEIKQEAKRLDRSVSWVMQRAWRIARDELKRMPSPNPIEASDEVAA